MLRVLVFIQVKSRALGDAGAVTTKDELAKAVRTLANYGSAQKIRQSIPRTEQSYG
jgi:dTDP-4-amino-4,6-dideoxygalactose transaminase